MRTNAQARLHGTASTRHPKIKTAECRSRHMERGTDYLQYPREKIRQETRSLFSVFLGHLCMTDTLHLFSTCAIDPFCLGRKDLRINLRNMRFVLRMLGIVRRCICPPSVGIDVVLVGRVARVFSFEISSEQGQRQPPLPSPNEHPLRPRARPPKGKSP